MTGQRFLLRLARDCSAASSAEFALVVMPFLFFLLGTFDAGRFIWLVNENEKAAQIGARWAVATHPIPGGEIGCDAIGAEDAGLRCYSYAINGRVDQGLSVPQNEFPSVTCSAGTGSLSCECDTQQPDGVSCPPPFSLAIDAVAQDAFDRLVARMRQIQPRLGPQNVRVQYAWSGLGYSGDPNGPDVAPTVTVSVVGLDFFPLILANMTAIDTLEAHYSLTMEDAEGSFAN
jgi:TadE-like protein